MRKPYVLLLGALTAACGSAPPPPPSVPAEAPAPTAAAVAAVPTAAPTPSAEPGYDDPEEASDPATLAPLFASNAKPAFPKASVGERECWQSVSLVGNARKDFDAIVARCGTPTGAVEFVKPKMGKLHAVKDKRDTFLVKVHGGRCYRFFGVADGTIQDLDILIEKGNGDLVGDDKTNGPVAIIESDKAWCLDRDGDYQFRVQVDGTGEGHYVFGVWARPRT